MTLKYYRGPEYKNTAENRAFERLCHEIATYAQDGDEVRILGNIEYEGGQVDAIVLKRHAITIVDFKDWAGSITVSPTKPWRHHDSGQEVRGGSYRNPFLQLCKYRNVFRAASRGQIAGQIWTSRTYPDLSYSSMMPFWSGPLTIGSQKLLCSGFRPATGRTESDTSRSCRRRNLNSRQSSLMRLCRDCP